MAECEPFCLQPRKKSTKRTSLGTNKGTSLGFYPKKVKKKKRLTHRNKIRTLSSLAVDEPCGIGAPGAVSETRDKLQSRKAPHANKCHLHPHHLTGEVTSRKRMEKTSTMTSEKLVFSHLFKALQCNFIYQLSIRLNAKLRLPCLSKTISEMESRTTKL